MRFWVVFNADEPVRLPQDYRYFIQSMIYGLLSDVFRSFLHDEGFAVGKRRMKLFTFSKLFGKHVREGPWIVFSPPVKLCVSSPVEQFVKDVANGILQKGTVNLVGNELHITSLQFPEKPSLGTKAVFKTLSPITVYSTLTTADGKKKTYYYSPFEEEFNELISKNLLKKAALLNGEQPQGYVNIRPVDGVKPREEVSFFKDTVVKGWAGVFLCEGTPQLIEAGYEAGFGSKNSQGYGLVEVMNDDRFFD
ncbi:MAG: CRISPR-associated endoribonuclease Cas6 [Candidatus Caldarchaeum sp.]|nr:CRISPR-associated endoribonuclease Cas6 [Candidatus Caldarchaeum sp.]MDW8436055.1 CRISPR-associated endoribonuclease Cas6 [Candidatus Caldarchaeum sp.]